MKRFIKPLPFKPRVIKGMSESSIVSHYVNNYGGACRRLRAIEKELASANATGFTLNGLKREELIARNSILIHELYFTSMGGGGDENKPTSIKDRIEEDFLSFGAWNREFSEMGKALGGGSGWVLLVWSPRFGRLLNVWGADHCHMLAQGAGILALDMYEHAYQRDFGADAASYVDCFMSNIDWVSAAKRLGVAELRDQDESETVDAIAPEALLDRGSGDQPVILDVRLDEDFDRAEDVIAGAERVHPDHVAKWAVALPKDRQYAVYCAYGFHVSRDVVEQLKNDHGINAVRIDGGIASWKAIGGPMMKKKS